MNTTINGAINFNKLHLSNSTFEIKDVREFYPYNPDVVISWYIKQEEKITDQDVSSKIEAYLKQEDPQKAARDLFSRSIQAYEEIVGNTNQALSNPNVYVYASKLIQETLTKAMTYKEISKIISKLIDDYLTLGKELNKYQPENDGYSDLVFEFKFKELLRHYVIFLMMDSKYHFKCTPEYVELNDLTSLSHPNGEFVRGALGGLTARFKEFREMCYEEDAFKGMNGFFFGLNYSSGWITQSAIILCSVLTFMQVATEMALTKYLSEDDSCKEAKDKYEIQKLIRNLPFENGRFLSQSKEKQS